MIWFIVWMLLSADSPLRDGGMSCDEQDYITACLTSQSRQHVGVGLQQVRQATRSSLALALQQVPPPPRPPSFLQKLDVNSLIKGGQ